MNPTALLMNDVAVTGNSKVVPDVMNDVAVTGNSKVVPDVVYVRVQRITCAECYTMNADNKQSISLSLYQPKGR